MGRLPADISKMPLLQFTDAFYTGLTNTWVNVQCYHGRKSKRGSVRQQGKISTLCKRCPINVRTASLVNSINWNININAGMGKATPIKRSRSGLYESELACRSGLGLAELLLRSQTCLSSGKVANNRNGPCSALQNRTKQ